MLIRRHASGDSNSAAAQADTEAHIQTTARLEVQKAFDAAINGLRSSEPHAKKTRRKLLLDNLFPLDPTRAPETGQTVAIKLDIDGIMHTVKYSIEKIATSTSGSGYAYALAPVIRERVVDLIDSGEEAPFYLLFMGQANVDITLFTTRLTGVSRVIIIAPDTREWKAVVETICQKKELDVLPDKTGDLLLPFNTHSFWERAWYTISQGFWRFINWIGSWISSTPTVEESRTAASDATSMPSLSNSSTSSVLSMPSPRSAASSHPSSPSLTTASHSPSSPIPKPSIHSSPSAFAATTFHSPHRSRVADHLLGRSESGSLSSSNAPSQHKGKNLLRQGSLRG